jgi:uncharacterized membrane protein
MEYQTEKKTNRMKVNASLRRILYICILLWTTFNTNAGKKVLFYGPTFESDSEAAELVANNPTEFDAIGSGSAVWTPGDPVASKDWSRKKTADFAAFDVIIIGDRSTLTQNPIIWTGALANLNTWAAAINGNIFIFGGDPETHAGPDGGGGNANMIGAKELIQQGIRFAADDGQAGPGIYIALAAIEPSAASPVAPNRKAIEHLLSSVGAFTPVHAHFDRVQKIFQHPILATVSDSDLSGWGQSVHTGFSAWPAGFVPVGLAIDATLDKRTPSGLLPTNVEGLVHILAKSPSPGFKRFFLRPPTAGRLINSSHTVIATFQNQDGTAPSPGKTVSFSLESGSVNFPKTGSGTTTANGTVSWSYTGGPSAGTDFILATVTDGATTYEARAKVTWAAQVVTVAATDPTAIEPAISGGFANTGTFTVTRSSSLGSLAVEFSLAGTADGADFTASPSFIVSFLPGQTTRPITITPRFDTASELTETVTVRLEPDLNNNPPLYAVGTQDEALINITSATTDTVTISVVDGSLDESSNSGTVRLHRTGVNGDAIVELEFSGTASFGDDYVLEGLHIANTAFIPDGLQDVDIIIHPVPDTRSEGTSESVTITIKASPDGTYAVGSPSAQTANIPDNDSVQIPALGWKLTDLGTFGGLHGEALAINSSGQVAGNQMNGGSGYKGALWDNGTYTFRNYPSSSGWGASGALGLNDAGTVVGYCYYFASSSDWREHPSYWAPGSTTPVLLPLFWPVSGSTGRATDINQRDPINDNGGVIVGYQRVASGNTHAAVWLAAFDETYPSTEMFYLGDLGFGDRNSFAYGINDFGEVVGKSQIDGYSAYHAFRSEFNPSNQPVPIDQDNDMGTGTFINNHTSEANDINNHGELVGASQFNESRYHAAYKAPNTPKNFGWYRLGVLGEGTANAGTQSLARGINDTGLIVGKSLIKVGNSMVWHGFISSNQGNPGSQGLIDLNDIKDPTTNTPWVAVNVGGIFYSAASQGWVINSVEKVDDSNWIVGYGTKSGVTRAFVLEPR